MQDFDDVVSPHSTPVILKYYYEAFRMDWPKPEEELVRDKDGKWKLYRPQNFKTKLKRFFTDYQNNPEKDVFKAWKNWETSHKQVEAGMDRLWPGKCISHVPFAEALFYACRDADATLRLYPVLKHMTARVRKAPQERWGDS